MNEVVDRALCVASYAFELQPHAEAPVAPHDARLHFDFLTGCRHAEAQLELRAALERTGSPDRQSEPAHVECDRRGDGISEAVGDGQAHHDARAAAVVESLRKE